MGQSFLIGAVSIWPSALSVTAGTHMLSFCWAGYGMEFFRVHLHCSSLNIPFSLLLLESLCPGKLLFWVSQEESSLLAVLGNTYLAHMELTEPSPVTQLKCTQPECFPSLLALCCGLFLAAFPPWLFLVRKKVPVSGPLTHPPHPHSRAYTVMSSATLPGHLALVTA